MRHIVTPLLRHYFMPALVVAQVALACAIICNVMFLIQQRLTPIMAPDGVSAPGQLVVAWQVTARGTPWPPSRLLEVESALAHIPGVTATSIAGSIPMETLVQMNGDLYADDGTKTNGAMYIGNGLPAALGLRIVAGRDFSVEERNRQYADIGINASGPALITRALADRLFPHGDALGKVIRIGADASAGRRTVVGIVEHLMRNEITDDSKIDIDYSMVAPGIPGAWALPTFLVRGRGDADMSRLVDAVKATVTRELGNELVPGIEPHFETYASLRDQALARSRASVWLLTSVSVVVLLVALAGIFGLTGYWVQQRTRQIGVRRALGARRRDIFQWLQLENGLLVCTGVIIGMTLAYAINLWLMQRFAIPHLPVSYLPLGALTMLVLGQLAILSPARRASRIEPSVAIRTV